MPAYLSRYMDTVGDGTGSINMAVAATPGAPVHFHLKAHPPTHTLRLASSRTVLEFSRTGTELDLSGFGHGAALPNGLLVYKMDADGAFVDVFKGPPVSMNRCFWRAWGGVEVFASKAWGRAEVILTATFHAEDVGDPFILRPGEALTYTVQDDLAARLNWMSVHLTGLDQGLGQ